MTTAVLARTSAEVLLERWMKLSLAMYAGTTLVFLLASRPLFALLNWEGAMFGLPPTPEPTEMFWLALTISMMVMLCVCCAYVARDVRRNVDFCVPIVFGKFAGAAVGLGAFFLWRPYPAHLTIAITDVPLGIVTLVLWQRVRRAR